MNIMNECFYISLCWQDKFKQSQFGLSGIFCLNKTFEKESVDYLYDFIFKKLINHHTHIHICMTCFEFSKFDPTSIKVYNCGCTFFL